MSPEIEKWTNPAFVAEQKRICDAAAGGMATDCAAYAETARNHYRSLLGAWEELRKRFDAAPHALGCQMAQPDVCGACGRTRTMHDSSLCSNWRDPVCRCWKSKLEGR